MEYVEMVVTRKTAFAALFFAALMLGVPSFFMGYSGSGLVFNAEAQGLDVDRDFVLAITELTVDTLNPNTYTMASEGYVIFSAYSTLLQYDENTEVIGDLARYWEVSPDGLDWYFKLVDNAHFVDPRNPDDLSHNVTAEDVAWSFLALQDNPESRLHFYFPNELTEEKIPIIETIAYPTDTDLYINLTTPFAPVFDSWTGAPVLPKYYWEGEDFIDFENDPVIGSGPFYVEYVEETAAKLARNPHWYQTENYGWQIHFDHVIILEELNDDEAMKKLGTGEIDCQVRIPPKKYLVNLPNVSNTVGFSTSAGFVYEFNLNQMTDEKRSELGGTMTSGRNNQLLLNETVKLAITTCINKTAFVDIICQGLGSVSHSLVPESSPWLYEIPDPIKPDTAAARKILNEDGWIYDSSGAENPSATPLWRKVDGVLVDELRFDFITLDTQAEWESAAKEILGWTDLAGVALDLSLKTVSQMNTAWYAADYDIWLWDWIFGVLQEASGVLEVLTTMSIGQSSDVYWSNKTFDDLYNLTLIEMDPVKRGELYDEMQLMAYKNMGCQPVAYSNDNYGVSIVNWERGSLGDWNSTYMLLPDVSYQWLGMRAFPNQNHAPQFVGDPVVPDVEIEVDEEWLFSASADDDDVTTPLSFRWFWGDGTKSDWRPGGTGETASDEIYHSYDEDGIYTAWVAVRETGASQNPDSGEEDYDDNFTTVARFKVTVRDMSNGPPEDVDFTWLPADPDAGDFVTFTGSATDPEGDDLYYTWDFGGGHVLSGEVVEYQFGAEGYYDATLYVDDKRLGAVDRPILTTKSVTVARNNAPVVDTPKYKNVERNLATVFDITAYDDEDDIRVTWIWGDGEIDVTTSASNSHTYSNLGYYTLTVWVDDLTGLPNHNVSDICEVYVYNPAQNVPAEIVEFTVTNAHPYTGEEIEFTAKALDADGDALQFTIDYGDETSEVQTFSSSDPNTIRTYIFHKEYSSGAYPTAYLYVDDGTANTISDGIEIEVIANFAPTLDPLVDVYGDTGESTDFEAAANDLDDDELTYYWEWDDGETTAILDDGLASHVYEDSGEYEYRVWVDDGKGHNVTDSATAYINSIPVLDPLTPFPIDSGVEMTFTATATDDDGDELTYTWWFEETDEYVVGNDIVHSFTTEGDWDYTVWVDDEFPLSSHNVSSTSVVTVQPAGVNDPPWITPIADMEVTVNEEATFIVKFGDPDGDPLTITWDFGDGEFAYEAAATVTHAYASVNVFHAVVWVDDCLFNTSEPFDVTVVDDMPPTAVADIPLSAAEDTDVTFDGSDSTDDILPLAEWEWYIVELDVTVTGEVTEYSFADPGVYTVELTVTDSIGQTDTDTATITITDTTDPIAVADADPLEVDMGDTVTLIGTGSSDNSGSIASYEWEFFDGVELQTLTGETVEHTFEVAGSYPVTLTVEDPSGNSASDDSLTIVVRDTEPPVAEAGDDQEVSEGDEVTFDSIGSEDNVDIVLYTWEFDYDGEAQELDGAIATFTFDIAGVYEVTLNVSDAAENYATDTVTITVLEVVVNEPPVADAGADQTVTVGDEVTFDGSASSDDNDLIENYTWTFTYDDLEKERYDVSPTFTFDIVGVYNVTLTVMDDDSQTDSDWMSVTVQDAVPTNDPPIANAGTDQTVTVGDEVTFDGSGSSDDSGVIENYTWSFTYDGEAKELYEVSPTFTFDIAGTYTVTLTVEDAEGETSTDSVTITVEEEEDEEEEEDDKKSFIESYGLALAIILALIIVALVLFFVMKGRKGGKAPTSMDDMSAGEPEAPSEGSTEQG
ncbi:MAG: PKD domain-containing protein [Thermoplasmata archaeon]|nr:PKD domain-containing protein [Thermoplasmata archaeon]